MSKRMKVNVWCYFKLLDPTTVRYKIMNFKKVTSITLLLVFLSYPIVSNGYGVYYPYDLDCDNDVDIVEVKNIDTSIKGSIKEPELKMSYVSTGGVPSEPESIPYDLHKELRSKGERLFGKNLYEVCGECERLNPTGVCIPDNHKLCDDGDPCTHNDRCRGRVCSGQRDPSTTNPNCSKKTNTQKTTICHIPPGNPMKAKTITIGASAVPAHMAHGDFIGECD